MEQKSEAYYYDLSHKEERWDQGDNKRFITLINETAKDVLEIGCGTASIVPWLKKEITYTGVDISALAIQRAKQFHAGRERTSFICESVDSLNLRPESYDVVAAFNSLEHVRNPKKMLTLILRALKPNGHIILTGPNLDLPWSTPNGIRHYKAHQIFFFRLLRMGDYIKRIFGFLPFRTIPENYTESTGKYEKPDDDLRHVLSSFEVITWLTRNHIEITYTPQFPACRSYKDYIKRAITFLPGMRYYGRHFTVIGKKK